MKDLNRPPQADTSERRDDFLEMLGSLAHKLSQPLTSLQGTVEVALMGEPDVKDYRRILEISLQEAQRVAEIVEALRDAVEMEKSGIQARPISWTETIEKALQEAASTGMGNCPRLVSDVGGEVWVKASPQRLNVVTIRLITGAARAIRDGRAVRISLSVTEEMASLAVCEESAVVGDELANPLGTPGVSAKPVLGELEKRILGRAVECQGGRLTLRRTSQTSRCYQLDLPLASPGDAGTGRP